MKYILPFIGWVVVIGFIPAAAQSLYSDPIAREIGDLLTIELQERTFAARESSYDNDVEASLSGAASIDAPSLETAFGGNAIVDKSSSSMNETAQRELLQGIMTARVTGVDQAGNLQIEGERKVNINGVTHLLYVSGIVRPLDVKYNNTIPSYRIADARVVYRRAGFTRSFLRPGTLVRVGLLGLVGVAIFLALQ